MKYLPTLIFISFFCFCCLPSAKAQVNESDSLELVNFYNTTCNDGCTLDWDFNDPVRNWEGVYLSANRVDKLHAIHKGLSGTIPDLNLPELTELKFIGNSLSGTIPNFSNLPKLTQLNLNQNQLIGEIPDFSYLPNLVELNLFYNQLNGPIPNFSNLPNLKYIRFYNNQLSDSIPNFNLINPQIINLSDNMLSGPIPDHSHLTNLTNLNISNNQLSGCFSMYLKSLCNISVNTSGNPDLPNNGNFSAFCNNDIGLCDLYAPPSDSLQLVNFYNTSCKEGCTLEWDFNQPVNTWEGVTLAIYGVENLILHSKGLSGQLPELDLPYLKDLSLYDNNFSGHIPDFNLPELIDINISANQLTGTVPNFTQPYLEIINLHGNQLTDTIPDFNLPRLRSLSLYNNQLTGAIPEFLNARNLQILSLTENRLSGPVPDFTQLYDVLFILIRQNNFSHEDIRENHDTNSSLGYKYAYSPQYFGNEQFHTDTIGATVILSPDPTIPYNNPSVRWVQNEEFITTSYVLNDTTYLIPSLDTVDIGVYQYRFIDYTLSPEVEFHSRPINNYVEGLDLEGEPVIQGELIVEYGEDKSQMEIDSIRNELVTEYGGVILDSCGCKVHLDLWKFGEDTLDVVREIIGLDKVNERRTSSTEIDGNRNNLFVPDYNEAEYILIGKPVENTNDIAKVVVGVIDTGINIYHNAIYDNLWSNKAEKNGIPGIDDDNNGYADDIFGYDFVKDSLMSDTHGHGTKVGGIIAANVPQDMDIQVMPVKTFGDAGRGSLFDMLCGVYYAIDNGSDIVNISAGYKGEKSVILQKALQYGRDKDVLFVVAAGNDTLDLNTVNYWPATFTRDTTLADAVITVTAVDNTYNLAEYASYGDTTVSIATSGQNILAPAEYDLESFDYIGGTSAATPIVSLALGIEKIKCPNKSCATLREDFLNNTDIAADLIDIVEEGRMLNMQTRKLSKLKVYLEGALLKPDGTYATSMKTKLNQRGILPGQTPVNPSVAPTPAGQPFTTSPWNYDGTEWGNTDFYVEDRVDWVLVSLRTETTKDSEIYRTAAQLKKDGTVEFYRPIMDLTSIADSVHIVVEHRNHLGVMSPNKVPVREGRFEYDFTSENSFRDPTGVGQVEIAPDVWAMIVGDSSQENDYPHYDINGGDKAIWIQHNGYHDRYLPSDYDMNGDVNGNDKAIWSNRIGLSNRVPK